MEIKKKKQRALRFVVETSARPQRRVMPHENSNNRRKRKHAEKKNLFFSFLLSFKPDFISTLHPKILSIMKKINIKQNQKLHARQRVRLNNKVDFFDRGRKWVRKININYSR